VVERGIAVSAIILRSVVRPSVAAFFLPDGSTKQRTGSVPFFYFFDSSNKADRRKVDLTDPSISFSLESRVRSCSNSACAWSRERSGSYRLWHIGMDVTTELHDASILASANHGIKLSR
jgi:hypothetical protein